MITQTYKLNLIPYAQEIVRGVRTPVVTLSQYDTESRLMIFELYVLGNPYPIPAGASGMLTGTKPDGTSIAYAVDLDENSAFLTMPEQVATVAGRYPAEIVLFDANEDRLGSANFDFLIEPSPADEDSIASETDIPVFTEYVAQAAAQAASARQSASDAAASAAAASASGESAAESASAASTSETNAQQSATSAAESATSASASAQTATDQAILSESWAVGGTGTREFEDYDNSKFYSDRAQQGAAAAGWVYFYIDENGYLHYLRNNSSITFYLQDGYLHASMEV